jgi:type IV fimbrial biogenesis protein FimT
VSLAVISILSINIAPSLSNLVARERSTVLSNSLTGALAYARTESIMKQENVITCQSNNGSDCNTSENWHNGWIIFTDNNKNQQRDPDEQLLRVYAATSNGTNATFRGSSNITHYVKYKPDGRASPNGSFLICNPTIGVGKALILHTTGRLRLSKTQTNGSAITCI